MSLVMTARNNIEVPTSYPNLNPQLSQMPTLYDYFALFPALIAAITPLILGLWGKIPSNQDKD